MKKPSFLDKVEERIRELEIARRVYFELGGDDEEPARALHRRTLALDASNGKPLLIVSRKVDDGEASRVAKYGGKPKRKPGTKRYSVIDKVRSWFKAHPGHAFVSGAMMAGLGAQTKEEKQGVYNALHLMFKAGELQRDEMTRAYSVARKGERSPTAL